VLKLYIPLSSYTTPFHCSGSHELTEVNEDVAELIVKSRVATESHPIEFVDKNVYTPALEYRFPFHKKSPQVDTLVKEVVALVIVKSRVAKESHPVEFIVPNE
jgi:hypothetical protein